MLVPEESGIAMLAPFHVPVVLPISTAFDGIVVEGVEEQVHPRRSIIHGAGAIIVKGQRVQFNLTVACSAAGNRDPRHHHIGCSGIYSWQVAMFWLGPAVGLGIGHIGLIPVPNLTKAHGISVKISRRLTLASHPEDFGVLSVFILITDLTI